jgi:short-subunit dehydrogenase
MKDRVAIITGASSGIGLAVARRWVGRSGTAVLVARSADKLGEAVRELGPNAAAFQLDVLDLAALEALPARVKDRFGRLDVVINNAGVNYRGPFDQFSANELTQILMTNLVAPVILTRAAAPHLERGGSVVQIASLAGVVPLPGEATYAASKAGLRAFARAAAADVKDKDIHIGCVCPGPVDTEFLSDLEHVPDIVLSQPLSTADEVAEAVLRCIDERTEEIALPARSGKLATLASLMPNFADRIRPVLEKRGAKAKQALMATRRRSLS